MKKTIKDYELNGKKVIIRCDFNVPLKNGQITDYTRINESLPTINYAVSKGAKVILLSHLGRVKTEEDKKSLKVVADALSNLLKKEVKFIPFTRGIEVEDGINTLNNGEIVLLENTRYEDLEGKKESKNDTELGKYWASLGDIFINDAFGTSHRSHASNVGISTNLPNGLGFLVEKEVNILSQAINNPKRPFVVILGGAKVNDKIKVIENIVKIADKIIIGGAMANTFLKAKDGQLGKSLLDVESIDFCKEILKNHNDKIILPVDAICAKEYIDTDETILCNAFDIKTDYMGLDIGPKTIELFNFELSTAKTIIWNGTLGVSEFENFSRGTKEVLRFIATLDATVVVGGGDTASAVVNFGYKDKLSHISTGGGASLEFLEGKELDGIKIIDDK